jgi:hypothetical protein
MTPTTATMLSHPGVEPALALSLLEHDGQGAQAGSEPQDAEPVRLDEFGPVRLGGRQADVQEQQERGAHRQVHEKAPAPADVLREPTAHHGPEQGPEENDETENGHPQRHLMARQAGADDGLSGGNHGAAGESLADPADDHLREAVGQPAHHGEAGEQQRIGQQELAQPEHPGEPRRERDHHDFRHQVPGRDPGSLRTGGADRALYLG